MNGIYPSFIALRDDDAEPMMEAIRMIKGVRSQVKSRILAHTWLKFEPEPI